MCMHSEHPLFSAGIGGRTSSAITKNTNWEIFTTFKKWDGVKVETF